MSRDLAATDGGVRPGAASTARISLIKDLLVGFIAPRRPAGWAETLDFDSLSEGSTENITDELRRRHDDVVWSIARRGRQTLHVVVNVGGGGRAERARGDVARAGVRLPSIREYEEA
ncbi:MAG: hypothetical protein OXC31_05225, partial [Spirochaetaceae bacterium]|nr:hypothetical protein [Spirochaetaceae bacterium]